MAPHPEPDFLSFSQRQDTRTAAIRPRDRLTTAVSRIIHGLPDSPIRDIHFENCRLTEQKGFKLEHARNVDLAGLTLDVKDGEPITETDVQ